MTIKEAKQILDKNHITHSNLHTYDIKQIATKIKNKTI